MSVGYCGKDFYITVALESPLITTQSTDINITDIDDKSVTLEQR